MQKSVRKKKYLNCLCLSACLASASTAVARSDLATEELVDAGDVSPATAGNSKAYDADLFDKDRKAVFINAEFLYWLPNEGAVDYAVKMDRSAWSSTVPTYAIGDYQNAHFDWSPGLRVAIGWFNAPKFWDISAQYTYLPSCGSNHVHAPKNGDEFLNGTWVQPDANIINPSAPLKSAKSHIDLRYHLIDLLFSRRFHTNEHLRVNVFGGLTSAFIYQKWKVSYEDINDVHSTIRNKWQFEGLGLRLGTKIDWFMGWNFYLTGMASTAILSGWYKNSAFQKTDVTAPGVDNSKPIRDVHFHDSRLAYTAQFLAGPSWQKGFTRMRAELFAGYEFTIWTNLHQIYRSGFGSPTDAKETFINDSNLSLQGLTVRATLDF